MKCLNGECQCELRPSEKFCGQCGMEVSVEEHSLITCQNQNCQKPQKETVKFCTECGSKMSTGKALSQGNENTNAVAVASKNKEINGKYSTIEPTTTQGRSNDLETDGGKIDGNTVCNESKTDGRKGLAVVCYHQKFAVQGIQLEERHNACDDNDLIIESLKKYNCEVMSHKDERSKFYEEELQNKVEDSMKGKDFLVFVLSTHGEEKEEGPGEGEDKGNVFKHFFFTKDGQYETQKLLDKISDLEVTRNKLIVFIIQACRSRVSNSDTGNMDSGTLLEINEEEEEKKPQGETANMPPPSNAKSFDVEDARGYMPPPAEEEKKPQGYTTKKPPPTSQGETIDVQLQEEEVIPNRTCVPHCDDCVVMFASMSGKYAYSKVFADNSGGWLIKAFSDTLNEYQGEDTVHILDVLTSVNQAVSQREALLKKSVRYLQVMIKEMEKLQQNSKIKELLKGAKELIISSLSTEGNVLPMIQKIENVLGPINVKAQSCYIHNLAFSDERDFCLKYEG